MNVRTVALAAAAVGALACASTQIPSALTDARALYQRLAGEGADQRVSGEMLRAQEAIARAENGVARRQNQQYVNGLSHIALRTAQTAEAANARVVAERTADSLRTARLNRLLTLSQSQRDQLAAQNQLSQQEVAALRERNVVVTQQAESERLRADSLRRVAEEANARLNQALTQLRSLVVEITNLQQTSRGLVISLSDILFDLNKATLKAGAEQNVRRIAAVLQQYPNHQISVEGHTDSLGSDAYNQRLSEERAASVRAALVAGGVDASRITSRGFGETQPVADNSTPAGRQRNRRVEVVVLGAGTLADAQQRGAAVDTTRTRIQITTDTTVRPDTTRRPPP
jgi:outer membrane protein OmpA-like peptidoglycan-associated protein